MTGEAPVNRKAIHSLEPLSNASFCKVLPFLRGQGFQCPMRRPLHIGRNKVCLAVGDLRYALCSSRLRVVVAAAGCSYDPMSCFRDSPAMARMLAYLSDPALATILLLFPSCVKC